MKRYATLGLALAYAHLALAQVTLPDIERGRLLYDNHCIVCHGRSVHARPARTPPTHAELRSIIEQWQQAEGLRWSEQEIVDVAAFLERVVYRTSP